VKRLDEVRTLTAERMGAGSQNGGGGWGGQGKMRVPGRGPGMKAPEGIDTRWEPMLARFAAKMWTGGLSKKNFS